MYKWGGGEVLNEPLYQKFYEDGKIEVKNLKLMRSLFNDKETSIYIGTCRKCIHAQYEFHHYDNNLQVI